MQNIDHKTVDGLGEEWAAFDQADLAPEEQRRIFADYFPIFPLAALPQAAEGFDLGCGSGCWAELMAERVGKLHCIDPSVKALGVTRRKLPVRRNVVFHHARADSTLLSDGSQIFGYSFRVLHHVPDTEAALLDFVAKLKPGGPVLMYLYYSFDNKPLWFRGVWKVSNQVRKIVPWLPFGTRKMATTALAAPVYWPLTRVALTAERAHAKVGNLPLAPCRHDSFYTMKTDALNRCGTRLEQRFSRAGIKAMMERSGRRDMVVRDGPPDWPACGRTA